MSDINKYPTHWSVKYWPHGLYSQAKEQFFDNLVAAQAFYEERRKNLQHVMLVETHIIKNSFI